MSAEIVTANPSTDNRADDEQWRWITQQLVIVAEVFGEQLTAARLRLYADDLADLSADKLALAFLRARRELRFFPKISELRELAGAPGSDSEADRAWAWINKIIRHHGAQLESKFQFDNGHVVLGERARRCYVEVTKRCLRNDFIDEYRAKFRENNPGADRQENFRWQYPDFPEPEIKSKEIPPPEIPDAIEYAVEQLADDYGGGLERIEQVREDVTKVGFVRKEFCEAFKRAQRQDDAKAALKSRTTSLQGGRPLLVSESE